MSNTVYLTESLDFNRVCRGCLENKGEMRSLFGTCLDDMLKTVANIEISVQDGLPQQMCVRCVLQVSRAFTFRQQCERSDNILRLYLSQEIKKQMDEVEESIHHESCKMQNDEQQQINDTQLKFEEQNDETVVLSDPADLQELEVLSNMVVNENEENSTIYIITSSDDQGNAIACSVDETNSGATIAFETDNNIVDDVGELDMIPMSMSPTHEQSVEILTETYDTFSESDLLPRDPLLHCDLCYEYCPSEYQLQKHKEKEHGPQKAWACDVCHKSFNEEKILKRHKKIHAENKPYVCQTCGMTFAESSNLTKHKRKHTGELRNVVGKPHLCSACGKRFKWASSLSKHMKYHTTDKTLKCSLCPKFYVEARQLQIHLRTHTGERPYQCEVCNRGFIQQCNLEKHMRVHTGEKPFKCPICEKGFSQSGYVAIHIRTHTGEKPYQCKVCDKSFAGSNTLSLHMRTHTGEKNYVCKLCGKAFARQETLMIHHRSHTGEKPHLCGICSRGFSSAGHLSGHMRSHTGEKSHACSVCGRRFAGTSSLKVHMRSHTGEKPFFCNLCGKSFAQNSSLSSHILSHKTLTIEEFEKKELIIVDNFKNIETTVASSINN